MISLCQRSDQKVRHWQQQQRCSLLLTALLGALLVSTAAADDAAAGLNQWDDSSSSWNDNTPSSWNTGAPPTWNTGAPPTWSSVGTPTASASGSSDGVPGPPTGPFLVQDNGGAGVKSSKSSSKIKDLGPLPGFSGGFLPRGRRCSNPNLPGCQSCAGDICTSCYDTLGDATFVLDQRINQCVCPPGYGIVAEEDMPVLWRRRLLAPTATTNSNSSSSSSTNSSSATNNVTAVALSSTSSGGNSSSSMSPDAGSSLDNSTREDTAEAVLMGVLMPPPPWATDCLPCPINYYSPGGPIGFAQCKVCPPGWTTGNASASADCLVPYCPGGQEVNRNTGRCRPCPFGTYRPATSPNTTCTTCPIGFTTPARSSTSMADCRVPICQPGQQLDIDLFICKNCTGNTISTGGVRANGPYQPFCQECPTFTAAVNRTVCLDEACPPPDAFRIVCKPPEQVPSCGPGGKPFSLNDYCTAYPVGSVIQWVRAVIQLDATTNDTIYSVGATGVASNLTYINPPVVTCPAGAFGSNVYYPFITSFKSRTSCFCTSATSCWFTVAGQTSSDLFFIPQSFNSSINITVPDPQLTSLRRLMYAAGPNFYTKAGARLGAYCVQDSRLAYNWQTSCLGPYLFNITYAPNPISGTTMLNGTLPAAVYLPGLSHMQQLTCAGCGLQGTLPPDWGSSNNLLALKYLDLGTNAFTGTLPEAWGGMVNLVNLTIGNFVGSSGTGSWGNVPRFWGNMRLLAFANFTYLDLDPAGCMPTEWLLRNALIPGTTLLTNAGQPFCTPINQTST